MLIARAHALSFLLALLVGLTSPSAFGEPASFISKAEALPYGDWQGEHFRPPKARLLDRAPAPLAEEPESARRSFELGTELGLALPHCPRGEGTGCATLAGGTEFGLALLARPSPYFAFGGELRLFAFTFGNGEAASARASALFAGMAGRVYFLESGNLDPYLELALGAGSLDLTAESEGQRISEEVKFAPSVRAAAGMDFVLSSFLRMGPFLGITRYAPASVAHCAGGACAAREPRASGVALGATSLGLRLTLAAGEML